MSGISGHEVLEEIGESSADATVQAVEEFTKALEATERKWRQQNDEMSDKLGVPRRKWGPL